MFTLSTVPQSSLGTMLQPIDWSRLPHKRFLNPGELEVLAALVRSVGARRMIEFGCNDGRTARALLNEVQGLTEYVGVDVPPGYKFDKVVQAREVPQRPAQWVQDDPRFTLLLRPHGSFDLTADDLGSCDVLFIDGDHGERAVVHDTELAHEIVRPGGMIIWHDYHTIGTVDVKKVLDSIAQNDPSLRHVEHTWLAYKRIPISGIR